MNNIITASEVQKGDHIKVTYPVSTHDDRTLSQTYGGVAHEASKYGNVPTWRTEGGGCLYTHETNAVIELLDRPKPKIEIPTNTFAQVTYKRHGSERFAVLTPREGWKVYDGKGDWHDDQTHGGMTYVANENPQVTDFKVVFEGVAK